MSSNPLMPQGDFPNTRDRDLFSITKSTTHKAMNTKEELLQTIDQTPEPLLLEVLDFLLFLIDAIAVEARPDGVVKLNYKHT